MSETLLCSVDSLMENGDKIQPDLAGQVVLRFVASPGLYQFSVVADASEFDWEELYLNLHEFGNGGRRTGPWDFDLRNSNKPLMPSYWVTLNGIRKGLWHFQRVSLEDMANKKMRGRFAFQIQCEGESFLELTPYRPLRLRWKQVSLERDPEDTLEPLPFSLPVPEELLPAATWRRKEFWNRFRDQLRSTHRRYVQPLERAFHWAGTRPLPTVAALPLLIADWKLNGNRLGLEQIWRMLDSLLDAPHWGNPCEDGYGHDGDIAAASTLKAVAWSFVGLEDLLTTERRERMRLKLQRQGNRFLEMALLSRDYWGGSLLQDHGWRCMLDFGTAALHLLPTIPDAQVWASFAVSRIDRALSAMPRDGVIPQSSYGSPYLFLDELAEYRDTLRACGGGELYARFPFRPIIPYLQAVLDDRELVMISAVCQSDEFTGGSAFLNQMASLFADSNAAYLAGRSLDVPGDRFYRPSQENAHYLGFLRGALAYDPRIPAVQTYFPPVLSFFPDSGLAHYRDEAAQWTLSVHCGPWCGYHASQHASGPSDQMGLTPGAGHFILNAGRHPLLVTPESQYSLNTKHRSCLLIDGSGQRGDIGYPMSIPRKRHEGERVESASWNEEAACWVIRLNLASAYPEEVGVMGYIREFILQPGIIICRDSVTLDRPRRLTWLFQGGEAVELEPESGQAGIFGRHSPIRLCPLGMDGRLRASVQETDVMHGYLSARAIYRHVRYDFLEPRQEVQIDFAICAVAPQEKPAAETYLKHHEIFQRTELEPR